VRKGFKVGLAGLLTGMMLFTGSVQAAGYTVQTGDSLWKISQWSRTTVEQLAQTNQLPTNTVLYPGQTLQVPGLTPYTVQGDESMWDITKKWGVTLNALISANPQIWDPNNIWNGLTIMVPNNSDSYVLATSTTVTAKPAASTDAVFPLGKGTYTAPFENNYATDRGARKHEGVDIMAKKGTPIYSVMDGEVVNYGWNDLGGWRLTIRVDSTTQFYYAHLNGYAAGIAKGSKVKKGQLIGYVGSTGYGPVGTQDQFEPHLHFGIYKTTPDWHAIDPYNYLKAWEQQSK
jgi:murein DD-endopeptidase MepM/ murein hydrolase activator NlpD